MTLISLENCKFVIGLFWRFFREKQYIVVLTYGDKHYALSGAVVMINNQSMSSADTGLVSVKVKPGRYDIIVSFPEDSKVVTKRYLNVSFLDSTVVNLHIIS